MSTNKGRRFSADFKAKAALEAFKGEQTLSELMTERLWRSLKYECVYLHALETGSEARRGIGNWMEYYPKGGPTPAWTAEHQVRHTGDYPC